MGPVRIERAVANVKTTRGEGREIEGDVDQNKHPKSGVLVRGRARGVASAEIVEDPGFGWELLGF